MTDVEILPARLSLAEKKKGEHMERIVTEPGAGKNIR
jgi:hypothetical protein